jgi:hypothetical protein
VTLLLPVWEVPATKIGLDRFFFQSVQADPAVMSPVIPRLLASTSFPIPCSLIPPCDDVQTRLLILPSCRATAQIGPRPPLFFFGRFLDRTQIHHTR